VILEQARAIPPTNTGDFAWSSLRRFQNVDSVEKEIIQLHCLAERWKPNAKKQARQLRHCLIQAREYFVAAKSVSLATKPNLLYYGMMSLALAEILLKQSGLSSLDRARAEHRHHGLSMIDPQNRATPSDLTAAASTLRAVPLEINGIRRGTFELWHRSCREYPIGGQLNQHLDQGALSSYGIVASAADRELPPVPTTGFTLLECLINIPGMLDFLPVHGVQPNMVRGKASRDLYPNDSNDFVLTVHPSSLTDSFLKNILVDPSAVDRITVVEVQSGLVARITNDPINGAVNFMIPPGCSWNTDETRFWTSDQCLNEFGFMYLANFVAGNYARYYPDRWLADVENSNPLSLAIEELLATIEQRAPLLTLSELSRTCLVAPA
jgi:hypothetical protein